LDLATGNLLWAAGGVGNASSPPTVLGETVFQNTAVAGTVLAFDVVTGTPRWETPTGSVISSPVADAAHLFAGTQAGHLLALSPTTGAILWDTLLGSEVYAVGTTGDLAFAAAFSGHLYALDTATGAIDWNYFLGSCCGGAVSAGDKVFASGALGLLALDRETGTLLWDLDGVFNPIVADGTLFARSGGEIVAIGTPYTPVPEPATLLLLGSGLAGIGGIAWRRKR
jgi:outer membrane protein assembly factor BamB